jgi:hypothetical protein
MASNRPALQLSGLPTVSEDGVTTTTGTKPIDRKAAKLNMLKRMRPPLHQRLDLLARQIRRPTAIDANPSTTYENRLTLMSAEIHDIKEFYQIYNNTPCENLRQRDSFHLFKRGVKPVWEDARNVHGGCWTFRVPKEKSTEFWMMLQVIGIGEGFDDVVDPSTLSFTSSPPPFPHLPLALTLSLLFSHIGSHRLTVTDPQQPTTSAVFPSQPASQAT